MFTLLIMILLLGIDVAMNSSLDYDNYNNYAGDRIDVNFPFVLLGLQLIIEISIFLALFLTMAETFLFRVGLLGFLLKRFWGVLLCHPMYWLITLASGIYRAQKLSGGNNITKLWNDDRFIFLSISQKLIAAVYYLYNINATIRLGERRYIDRNAWKSLIR